MHVGGSWRYVVFGAAIVLMMTLRPQGIVTRAMVDTGRLQPPACGVDVLGGDAWPIRPRWPSKA